MVQLTIDVTDEQMAALRAHAARRHTSVASLLTAYVAYLAAGGPPLSELPGDLPTSAHLAAVAERGGSFDWLADEPDLYGPDDGEPV